MYIYTNVCRMDEIWFLGTCLTTAHEVHQAYTYTHTYIHTYIHTSRHTHTYTHIYIHTCMHACIHTYIHTYIHIYIRTYIRTYVWCTWKICSMRYDYLIHIHLVNGPYVTGMFNGYVHTFCLLEYYKHNVCVHICVYAQDTHASIKRTWTRTYMHACMHTCIHTYIHTYIHKDHFCTM